jgi:uncharacterized membrane-anchored protein YjiN (DUF445 family)
MRSHNTVWAGYVQSFSEAAMVGALADWFAVTALFNHPMGIPIPHTNLIENRKKAIGDNLGNFVVSNFLTAANIRPYINKINVAAFAGQWLGKEKNRNLLLKEIAKLITDILHKTSDEMIVGFLSRKARGLVDEMPLHTMLSGGLEYFLNRNEHEKFVTVIASRIKDYIVENEDMVKEKVREESSFFIPRFVDNTLAKKISKGLINYFDEIENDPEHHLRKEITAQLYEIAEAIRSHPSWKDELQKVKANVLSDEKVHQYASDTWRTVKTTLQRELSHRQSALMKYIGNNIDELSNNLQNDAVMQQKIDGWIRVTAYKYILRNASSAGSLISNTVGNWPGRELSRKLELEVGKDLQYIRINGTLVGGLVGLLIHVVSKLFHL